MKILNQKRKNNDEVEDEEEIDEENEEKDQLLQRGREMIGIEEDRKILKFSKG
jgi:hypothetical protein